MFQTLNDRGLTIILVTHELDIASSSRSESSCFRDGRIRRDELQSERPSAPHEVPPDAARSRRLTERCSARRRALGARPRPQNPFDAE